MNRALSQVRSGFTREDGSVRPERVIPVALVAVGIVGLVVASSRRDSGK